MMANLPINGLPHKDLIMAAYTMMFCVKENFDIDKSPYVKLLSKEDKNVIERLGIILSLAESLDKKKNGNIMKVECNIRSECLYLHLVSKGTTEGERKEIEGHGANFTKVFGKTLKFE
jgi:exopolyphosphatase/guanosine-5'-triphosphate,3'-diphosphate pyrophosphatase